MDESKRSSISQADSDEKIGEFWDTHDFTVYDDSNRADAEFEITCAVPYEPPVIATPEELLES